MRVRLRLKRKIFISMIVFGILFVAVMLKLGAVMIFNADYYGKLADDLHERERVIKAERGKIISADNTVLADNKTVCTVSVIYSQMEDRELVIDVLSKELSMDRAKVASLVNKKSSMERIKSNVSKEVGDAIKEYDLPGVKVDEDSRRYYPFGSLASKVIGFTGSDNQGIVGLEVKYDDILMGNNGKILTVTDAYGRELEGYEKKRIEPESGENLVITMDYNIQAYAQQLAYKAYKAKQAKSVSIIVMNPNDGSILAMVNVPEYDLNNPFSLISEYEGSETDMDTLNKMWRNFCINDTYEPGSTFKIVTATAALEKGVVSLNDSYYCRGNITVGGRIIRCHNTRGHGSQTFAQTLMNSCNPAFITWGSRVGVDGMYEYMEKLGLLSKTGIDLPGEAGTIIHKKENVGEVELATVSFGQSFQVTPMGFLRAVCAVINGGNLITPHFASRTTDDEGNILSVFEYETVPNVISEETSEMMRGLMELVVSEGGGKRCYIEGYRIGGKTATSQKLPRSASKYIASFIGFAPADNPQVIAMCIIDEPQGIYYGGTIAAPVIADLFENILPYLGI